MQIEMFDRRTVLLVISILVLPGALGYAAGQESHLNFDEAEEDVNALYITLGRTKHLLEKSLNRSLDVNLTVDHDDYIVRHDQGALGEAYNHSMDALDTIGYSEDILEDIEGEVSSYEYLEALFKPYSRTAHNVSYICETHKEFITDLKTSIDIYKDWVMEDGVDLLEGLEHLNMASYNIRQVMEYIESSRDLIQGIQDERLDNQELLELLDQIQEIFFDYENLIEELLYLYRSVHIYMGLIVPSTAHPGEEITVSGSYVKKGEYVGGAEVDLYVDNESIRSSTTDEDGFFEFQYSIPWDVDIGVLNISVSTEQNVRYADIEIEKYPSWIELSADRDEYYQENIKLSGTLQTDAKVPLDSIYLNSSFDREVPVSTDGDFEIVYDADLFPWGTSSVMVDYGGNDTIMGSSASVYFDVNIPTNLTLHIQGEDHDEGIEEFHLQGFLKNASSQQGLHGLNVSLLVDSGPLYGYRTSENGEYGGVLDIEEVAPEDGMYRLKTVFNGTEMYRSSSSEPIYIYRRGDEIGIGEDPDELRDENDTEEGTFPWYPPEEIEEFGWFVIIVALLFLVYLYFFHRKDTSSSDEKEDIESEPSIVIPKKGYEEIKASSEKDIPSIYKRFIEGLVSRTKISVTKGTTHRDIERELLHKYEVDEIKTLTSIFEKVFFADNDLSSNDLQRFNKCLKRVNKVVR